MWKCSSCHHLELAANRPMRCPVCGADQDKLLPHQISGIKGTKTLENLKAGFVAESQAHQRDVAFALQADKEELPQIARLFRAVAEAEGIHAFNHLRLLGGVSETQENLEAAFARENFATTAYPEFIREANEEGNTSVATIFSFSRDVERVHAKLYRKALDHMMQNVDTKYYVCGVCGYVSDGELPDQCPVCGAPKEKFRTIA